MKTTELEATLLQTLDGVRMGVKCCATLGAKEGVEEFETEAETIVAALDHHRHGHPIPERIHKGRRQALGAYLLVVSKRLLESGKEEAFSSFEATAAALLGMEVE